jgi:hypothetical protein
VWVGYKSQVISPIHQEQLAYFPSSNYRCTLPGGGCTIAVVESSTGQYIYIASICNLVTNGRPSTNVVRVHAVCVLGRGQPHTRLLVREVGWLYKFVPQSHQTFRPVRVMKLLGIMLRNRCWSTIFHIITTRDIDG